MRSVPWWKIVLVVALLIWAVYEVYPSIRWYSLPKVVQGSLEDEQILELKKQIAAIEALREATDNLEVRVELSQQINDLGRQIDELKDRLKALQSRAIPVGLDLKGGVHVVLKVDVEARAQELRNQIAALQQERAATEDKEKQLELTQRIRSLERQIDEEKSFVIDQVVESLRNRIDNLGVKEPVIQRQGATHILVQIPAITDPADVLQVLGKTAQLEFRFAKEEGGNFLEVYEVLQKMDEALPAARLIEKVQIPAGGGGIPYILREDFPYFQEHLFTKDEDGRFTNNLKEEVKPFLPYGYTLMFGNPEEFEIQQGKTITRRNLYLVSEKIELTGRNLVDASVQLDTAQGGSPFVSFSLDPAGAKVFSRVTGNNIGKHLAIVLDGTVYSAPRIQSKIPGGHGQITGNFTLDEAKLLAVVLRSGALPATVTIEENRIIDPTLGADSIRSGILAGFWGSLAVVVSVLLYYSWSGLIAILCLFLNVLLLLAAMAFIPATLTLPGIAGVFLTIGMAVDANVLIYERMREEMASRVDRAVALIVDRGFGRAFWTIFDSNLTTLITAVVLFQFGTGPVKGFAVTLSLGIIISMFTAIFVARMIYDTLTGPLGMKKLHIGKIYLFKNANYDFLGKRKVAGIFSLVSIVLGLGYFAATRERNLGVDLTTGYAITLKFAEPADEGKVRQALANHGLLGFSVYKFANEPREVVTRCKEVPLPEGQTSVGAYIRDIINQELPQYQPALLSEDFVGPTVGKELIGKAIWALIASSIFIMIYIAIRFELGYAIAATVALFHDLFFTFGVFCLTNLIPGQHREINLPIIAALLMILGYSLNDTIVVFDRIRENRRPGKGTFDKVVNDSINQTLSRTIITGGTTLFVVIALLIFGGPGINDFAYTLLIGILIGTYSSIFIASPVLLWYHHRTQKRVSAI